MFTIKTTAQEGVNNNEEVMFTINVTEGDPPAHTTSRFQDKFKAEQYDEQDKQSENLIKINQVQRCAAITCYFSTILENPSRHL